MVSDVPQGCVLGPLLFLLYTRDLPIIIENAFVGYADDSTLLAKVSEQSIRVPVVSSLTRKSRSYWWLVQALGNVGKSYENKGPDNF